MSARQFVCWSEARKLTYQTGKVQDPCSEKAAHIFLARTLYDTENKCLPGAISLSKNTQPTTQRCKEMSL
jgi:hypothetical protein